MKKSLKSASSVRICDLRRTRLNATCIQTIDSDYYHSQYLIFDKG